MSLRRFAATLALSGSALLVAAPPAAASFHFAHIHRIMTGLGGSTDVQYVEIVQDAGGQNFVDGTVLAAFDATGAFDHIVLTVDDDVTGGGGKPWIMASQGFQAASGIAPDFVFDSTGGNGLPAEDGMVCWGQPNDEEDPADYVDCISYGDYTGPDNVHTSAPSTVGPFGHGLVRTSNTNNSANDYACEDPAAPRNNTGGTGSIEASAPCSGAECGNFEIEEPEQCDDGDAVFAAGDYCTADCTFTPCGVPTNSGAVPKTSDALFVLRAAVQGTNCDVQTCDVNDSGTVTAADALAILKKAVGQSITLTCTQLPPG